MMSTASSALFWNNRLEEAEPGTARAALGGRLRAVRQHRLGLTLAEFGRQVAEQAGRRRAFSNVTVANWESGRQEPNFTTLQAIAHLAHLPLCFFAGIGELDEFPRIDWFNTLNHTHDAQLRRLSGELQELSPARRRLVFAAIGGLLEGLEQEQARAAQSNGTARATG